MALESRIRELDARHRDLDAAIEAEVRSPASDDAVVAQMKKQKLRIKEELEALKAKLVRH